MGLFAVSNCTYDGTSGSPNPLCTVTGTVNGRNVYVLAFFAYLIAASAASQMQAALRSTPVPYPTFPGSAVVAGQSAGPFPVAPTVVSQALIGSWTA
jgi:hypothetical protein